MRTRTRTIEDEEVTVVAPVPKHLLIESTPVMEQTWELDLVVVDAVDGEQVRAAAADARLVMLRVAKAVPR